MNSASFWSCWVSGVSPSLEGEVLSFLFMALGCSCTCFGRFPKTVDSEDPSVLTEILSRFSCSSSGIICRPLLVVDKPLRQIFIDFIEILCGRCLLS